ncbi:MAG: UDP-N-acetylglucosamine 2-epimerase (non-hydrolyzing) [Fimbriimonadaceae bacterium]
MGSLKIACVVGTRPDAIKSAPVVLALRQMAPSVETVVVSTGQHREMLEQALNAFGLKAEHDLAIMRQGQTLAEITTRAMEGLDRTFADVAPDYVAAQGDTTTTFVAGVVAFYRRIPFGHVEAGLRTPTIDSPFPEEFNRRAAGLVATHHFAPTAWARDNLLAENKPADRIFVTGNTGIDAVQRVASEQEQTWWPDDPARVVLLTTHRRENWGEPQRRIAATARRIVEAFEDVRLVVPMHRNPQVREVLHRVLDGHERIHLIEPPDYAPFTKLMQRSTIILTDSGGVQEEAPSFGVPVLVLREHTERPEGVQAGAAKLVGTDEEVVFAAAVSLLTDPQAYAKMVHAGSPYGDGRASERVASVILRSLGIDAPEVPMWI